MDQKTIKTFWKQNELEKLYEAIDSYNRISDDDDKVIIEDIQGNEISGAWLTISYQGNKITLLRLGIYLGRAGL